jgi:hypothetical protein
MDGKNCSEWDECNMVSVGFPRKIESAFATRFEDLLSEKPRERHDLKYVRLSPAPRTSDPNHSENRLSIGLSYNKTLAAE